MDTFWTIAGGIASIFAILGGLYGFRSWLQKSRSRGTASTFDIEEAFGRFKSDDTLRHVDRIELIRQMSQGPARQSMRLLQQIVSAPSVYSRAEVFAVGLALQNLEDGKMTHDVLSRVEAEQRLQSQGVEGPAFLMQSMLFWERPTSAIFQGLVSKMLDSMKSPQKGS